ncbi:hypothetical protein L6164_001456 [Bauhinia variegata]|uniref:Uncharacterized protein n=1 Tax=Bauhinia variegata TaxID=167791 RepID=A0ACB9Q9V1_BAUVA|nr:hypothetical protein L6164_001456 [Bauhinia variegata]
MADSLVEHQPIKINGENKVKEVTNTLPANGGSGTYSYSKNSYFQRLNASIEEKKIEEEIYEKLDVQNLVSASNIICVADLGCATGPNTFVAVQNLLEAIKHKYQTQYPNHAMPEFHVFFNDLISNDFNTLFATLPKDRQYFAAGVPGSFHDRLFPESSLHFAYTNYALHLLSKSPEELQDKDSPAWNKGRIHYTNASKEVVEAYATQFAEDARNFLDARAKELAPGGMLVIIMQGIPFGMPHSEVTPGMIYDNMGCILMDMAKEGLFDESKVDSFNLPYYAPTPEEIAKLVEENGYLNIERMELTDPAPWLTHKSHLSVTSFITHVRAALEGTIARHFGDEITDEMFQRLVKQISIKIDELVSKYREKTQLFVVLKRKETCAQLRV